MGRKATNSFGLWLGIAIVGCAFLAPAAQAGWLPPVVLSASSEHTENPHVVLDSEGNATAVWAAWNGVDMVVESAYRPAGEGWGTPIDLSEPELAGEVVPGAHDADSPQIVVDRNGNVTVIWERYDADRIVLQTVDRPTGGSWTEPIDIGEVGLGAAPEPWIAIDWEGNSTAVWKKGEVIQSSFRPFAGEWQTPVPLSGEESFVPQAAMDARGDATAVWMHFDGSHYVVESAYRPEQGEWGAATLVSQPGEEGGNPHVAIDAKGDSLVAWRGEDEGDEFVRASYRPAGGSWGPPADVSVAGEQVQGLRVAVDPDGNAIVAWAGSDGEAGGYDVVRAAYKAAAGDEWEAPVGLSTDGGNGFPSDVVFDTGGDAALVWQRWDGTTNLVQAAYRPAGEEWEPAVDLSEAGKQGMDAVVVLDAPGDSAAADGHATAVWVSQEAISCSGEKEAPCHSDTVQAAGYDPDGIPEVEVEAPAAGVVGEPVEVSTPTAGLFEPLIEFGDGASVPEAEAVHTYDEPGEYEVKVGGAELLGYRASAVRTIAIAPAGSPSDPGGGSDPKTNPGSSGPGASAPKGSTSPFSGESPPAAVLPSPACVKAEATRDQALRGLKVAGTKLNRAHGTAAVRRLSAAKRKQVAALRRAHRRVAATC